MWSFVVGAFPLAGVCFSLVLMLCPPQAMFSTDLMESRQERVAINGVESQMIGMLVSYAYTAEVVISKANVQVRSNRYLPVSLCSQLLV